MNSAMDSSLQAEESKSDEYSAGDDSPDKISDPCSPQSRSSDKHSEEHDSIDMIAANNCYYC